MIDALRIRLLAWRRDRRRPLPKWGRWTMKLLDSLARMRG
jgi:hypothetical protein